MPPAYAESKTERWSGGPSEMWFSSRVGGEGRVDGDAGGAEVDEGGEGVGAVEAEGAVADQAHLGVQSLEAGVGEPEAGVGEPEADGGEDRVAVAADGARELDERLELAA
jgi:hypothetical protein